MGGDDCPFRSRFRFCFCRAGAPFGRYARLVGRGRGAAAGGAGAAGRVYRAVRV